MAEDYWVAVIQGESFPKEVDALKQGCPLPKNRELLPFRPIWDKDRSLILVGGRMSNSSLAYSRSHPAILDGKHSITKLIIRAEHLRLMHAGPTLLASSLSQRFHIIGARKIIRSITRQCVICRRHSIKPQVQLLCQLPAERVSPTPPFQKSGVDYAGPFQIKYGHVRKPTIVKAYIWLCVCSSLGKGGPLGACVRFDNWSLHRCPSHNTSTLYFTILKYNI